MTFNELIHESCVIYDLNVSSKKQLFQEMASVLIKSGVFNGQDIAERDIVAGANDRERLGSTGVGYGVALPHARLAGIDRVYLVFARLETPIDFESVDDRPVDLVALLIAPEHTGGEHLRALAMVSRRLRREDMRARLRGAPDSKSLYISLIENPESHAA